LYTKVTGKRSRDVLEERPESAKAPPSVSQQKAQENDKIEQPTKKIKSVPATPTKTDTTEKQQQAPRVQVQLPPVIAPVGPDTFFPSEIVATLVHTDIILGADIQQNLLIAITATGKITIWNISKNNQLPDAKVLAHYVLSTNPNNVKWVPNVIDPQTNSPRFIFCVQYQQTFDILEYNDQKKDITFVTSNLNQQQKGNIIDFIFYKDPSNNDPK
jgi:hypothetical protein